MNPNSPEDRLLDELLREQSQAPDEAFLKQIEAAVDAGPPRVVKHPGSRNSRFVVKGVLSIAAAVAVVAGGILWSSSQSRHSRTVVAAGEKAVDDKAKVARKLQELSRAIRDKEDKIEERRKVLGIIAETSATGENMDVRRSLIEKLMYVKDESLAWVLLPGYGVEGRFQFKYQNSSGQSYKSGSENLIGPGDSFFPAGSMAHRFKLLGSEVRREMNKKIYIEVDVAIVRVEDQRPNKRGVVYEFPSPLAEQRKNEFLQYDRTAVFSLEATGMEGNEFKVEENTVFSLPPGGEKKDYLLKSITPAAVIVEMVDSGQLVEISKGAMPAGAALAVSAANSGGSPMGDIRQDAIKRGLDAESYADAKRDLETDQQLLKAMRSEHAEIRDRYKIPANEPPLAVATPELVKKMGEINIADAEEPDGADGQEVRVIQHEDGFRSVFSLSLDRSRLTQKLFTRNGDVAMTANFRLNSGGDPIACQIRDTKNQEIFKITYGYSKSNGRLVEELMFDARVKRTDPGTGRELPVRRVTYAYDEQGSRGDPIVFNLRPGNTLEQVLGYKGTGLGSYPFEVVEMLRNGENRVPRPRVVPPPAEEAEVVPVDRNR